jgi:hypothetical protein
LGKEKPNTGLSLPYTSAMELKLTPELEELIQRHLDSGRFDTPYQVVIDAVVQLPMKDPDLGLSTAEWDVLIQEGLDSAENEPLLTPEEARAYLAGVRAELRREAADVKAIPGG